MDARTGNSAGERKGKLGSKHGSELGSKVIEGTQSKTIGRKRKRNSQDR